MQGGGSNRAGVVQAQLSCLSWSIEAMEVIVVRALTKIAVDCHRKQGALKTECRDTLGRSIVVVQQ